MAAKIDIEDIKMVLASKDLEIDITTQTTILETLQEMADQLSQKSTEPRVKYEFLVMPIVSDKNIANTFNDHSFIVLQVPENTNPEDVQDLVYSKLFEYKKSNEGKKTELNTVSSIIGKIKAKELVLDNNKIKLKTKVPVQGISIINEL